MRGAKVAAGHEGERLRQQQRQILPREVTQQAPILRQQCFGRRAFRLLQFDHLLLYRVPRPPAIRCVRSIACASTAARPRLARRPQADSAGYCDRVRQRARQRRSASSHPTRGSSDDRRAQSGAPAAQVPRLTDPGRPRNGPARGGAAVASLVARRGHPRLPLPRPAPHVRDARGGAACRSHPTIRPRRTHVLGVEPGMGFEPTTPALRKRCSTVELSRPVSGGL